MGGKKLTKEERVRRDAAYEVWRRHSFDFAAAAAEVGVTEKELTRWHDVHKWWQRHEEEVKAEIAPLLRLREDLAGLDRLITGVDANNNPMYVPVEMKLEAISQRFQIAIDFSPETAEQIREALRPHAYSSLMSLARTALGIDQQGERYSVSPAAQISSREYLEEKGLVESSEWNRIKLDEIENRIKESLAQQGISIGYNA